MRNKLEKLRERSNIDAQNVYKKIGIFIKIGMWVTMLGAIGLSSYINYVISFIVYSYIVCI